MDKDLERLEEQWAFVGRVCWAEDPLPERFLPSPLTPRTHKHASSAVPVLIRKRRSWSRSVGMEVIAPYGVITVRRVLAREFGKKPAKRQTVLSEYFRKMKARGGVRK